MQSSQTVWMGLGIFERLYAESKIENYFESLNDLPNKKIFILADEITGCNNFVLSSKKFDLVNDKKILENQIEKSHQKFVPKYNFINGLIKESGYQKKWKVEYWSILSKDKEFQKLYRDIKDAIERFENYYLKKEVIRVTIFGFGARLRKNFTESFVNFVFDKNFYRYLETLSEYTLAEVVATLHLAKKGYIKAGHEEEKPFDELSTLCYERFKKEFFQDMNAPEYYYI